MMVFLIYILLLGQIITGNIRTQAENDFGSCSSEIELNIEKNEHNEETTYNLYCKSKKKPFDDSAEFTVDGFSREHILIIKNRCYDRKKKECSFDYCECDPTHNQFTVKFKMGHLEIGQTFGCLIRLRNDATGNFLKIYTSNEFNGTDFTPDECNIKVIGTTTSISSTSSTVTISTISTVDTNYVDCKHTIPLQILLAFALIIILSLLFVIYCICKKLKLMNKNEKGIQLKERRKDDKELEDTGEEDALLSSQKPIKVYEYFAIHCKHEVVDFYDYQSYGRILDMCFVKLQEKLFLVYIDADKMKITKQQITQNDSRPKKTHQNDFKEMKLDKQPNRMSKINNKTVAVIYKKKLEILIINVENMKKMTIVEIKENDIIKDDNAIQGILALSATEFILSDKMHLYECRVHEKGHKSIATIRGLKDYLEFDTARRFAHIKDIVFIADENDKKLTSIDASISEQRDQEKDSIGQYISRQDDHNRGLQNVRAIAATQSRIYAATSAGISVFCHDKGLFKMWGSTSSSVQNPTDYKMLVEYEKHVEHTRGLSLQCFQGYVYMALSCVIKQQDVILVFKQKREPITTKDFSIY